MNVKELKQRTIDSDEALKNIECLRKKCHIMYKYAVINCHPDIAEGFQNKYKILKKQSVFLQEENTKCWEEYSNALKVLIH